MSAPKCPRCGLLQEECDRQKSFPDPDPFGPQTPEEVPVFEKAADYVAGQVAGLKITKLRAELETLRSVHADAQAELVKLRAKYDKDLSDAEIAHQAALSLVRELLENLYDEGIATVRIPPVPNALHAGPATPAETPAESVDTSTVGEEIDAGRWPTEEDS